MNSLDKTLKELAMQEEAKQKDALIDWEGDLKFGEKVERQLIPFFESWGYIVLEWNKDNKYDLKLKHSVTDHEISVEVKADRQDGDDMRIETHKKKYCNVIKSGISVSKADFFIYAYPYQNTFYLFRTETLRTLIYEHSSEIQPVDGGDKDASFMKNINRYDHARYKKLLDGKKLWKKYVYNFNV